MKNVCAVILAAGDGKRMKSVKPKALKEVLFKPMLNWVIDAVKKSGIEHIAVIVGTGADMVREYLPQGVVSIEQKERLGTGHAVMQAQEYIRETGCDSVIVLTGDAPFVDSDAIMGSYDLHEKTRSAATIVAADVKDPTGYGRIVCNQIGNVLEIVEHKDASDEIRRIKTINSGTYWFEAEALLWSLARIKPQNAQGEYYLTDTIKEMISAGRVVSKFTAKNGDVVMGANDRKGLYVLNEIARKKVIDQHMTNGVTFIAPDSCMVSSDTTIGADTDILPGVIIKGHTTIGRGCTIGPNTVIEDCVIGDGVTINASQVYSSKIENEAVIGPFSHIRPGSTIGKRVQVGNFVEIKNSVIGEETRIKHLTYIGDSDLGSNVNIGCGCVTVNYDGKEKHRTMVGNGVFVGCNVSLVAPVHVGDGAYIAAGSTITEDVKQGDLAIARARQVNKSGYAAEVIKNGGEVLKKEEAGE